MVKILPHDIDTEEALIGALLIDNSVIRKVVNQMKSNDFYSDRNRAIYQACLNLYTRRESINQITVAQEIARGDKLKDIGGAAYLSHCISMCPTSLDAEYYAAIIYRLSVSRQIITLSEQISKVGYQALPDVNQSIGAATEAFDTFRKGNLVLSNQLVTPVIASNDISNMVTKYSEPGHAPSWGFKDLDEITAGIYPEYVIIAARPSIGKSQLSGDVADNLSQQGKCVLYASAEMSKDQIYERKLTKATRKSVLEIRKSGLDEEDEKKIFDLAGNISNEHVHYMAGKLMLDEIISQAMRLQDKQKLDAVFIDYLGALMDCQKENRDTQSTRISRVSNRIQNMVHDLNIPVIVACQLNREVEHRNDDQGKGQNKARKPKLSDLRDSGSLEQDADVVFLLHRETLPDDTLSNILQVKMAKNRQIGSKPSIKLVFDNQMHKYTDYFGG